MSKKLISAAMMMAFSHLEGAAAPGVPDYRASPQPASSPGLTLPPPLKQTPLTYEKCFGVNAPESNSCAHASFAGTTAYFRGEASQCAGTAPGCDPSAWIWVPKGLCTFIVAGADPQGRILHGTLEPTMKRGFPAKCTPYDEVLVQSDSSGLGA